MPTRSDGILRVGIDTGGTFTDIVWVEHGMLGVAKVPSTPAFPANAVMEGLSRVPSMPGLVCHGTTVGTNAVLARQGGPAGMVVTAGFRDVLRLGRGERDNLYSKDPHRPSPLVSRENTLEINLRIDPHGQVLASPTPDEIKRLAESLLERHVKAIALGILHSAQHPSQETSLAEKIAELTGIQVFPSSAITACPREYERWTAASLAAYLAPVLGSYLTELAKKCPAQLALMVSSGGLLSPSQVLANPTMCVLSGPAGGAIAALSVGGKRVLALDMGGTSTDVTLLADGLPRTRESSVAGLPVPLPSIDIHTIGAGGGSIVKIDKGGMLALGPESAGADPGPACYGKGGPATLTDVVFLAGGLFASRFMGGNMPLDSAESMRALMSICPEKMEFDELLDGVKQLARVHLVGALRKISVARGIDPSAPPEPFILVPFGGAGAFFAVDCARELGLKEVLHPKAAGVFSALGLAAAPIAIERERAVLFVLNGKIEHLLTLQRELTIEVDGDLSKWGQEGEPVFSTVIECRYVGQTHTIDIPFAHNSADIPVARISADIPFAHISASESLRKSFETAYRTRFTYVHPNTEIEVVAMRVRGEIPPPKIDFPDIANSGRGLDSLTRATTRIQVEGKWLDALVYDRSLLPIEHSIKGPSLVVEDFATLYLPPESSMYLDRKGHARITA